MVVVVVEVEVASGDFSGGGRTDGRTDGDNDAKEARCHQRALSSHFRQCFRSLLFRESLS